MHTNPSAYFQIIFFGGPQILSTSFCVHVQVVSGFKKSFVET